MRRRKQSHKCASCGHSHLRAADGRQQHRNVWAERRRKSPYDTLLERAGREIIYMPLAYRNYSFGPILPQLTNPNTVLSLSDGGAHCGVICDASIPTHWVSDRSGGRIPLEIAVKHQTHDTAQLYGLLDRGTLAPGMKADINLIDFKLQLHPPEMVFDLPANGRRFVQRADGYKFTIVNGEVTFEDGQPTGEMPGKVVRGPQPVTQG
jgi:N-acyl-D-amino-acid deacylase